MVIKEFIQKLGEKSRERKERIKDLDEQIRIQKLVEDRQKSSNERELEKYIHEDREEEIKKALDVVRKKRRDDINFNHNCLDIKNITSHTDWEVLKERNMFKNSKSTLKSDGSVLKNNPNLLKNNRRLLR